MGRLKLNFKASKLAPPRASIYVSEHPLGERGETLLTPADVVSQEELDHWIDGLIANLEEIRREGQKKFRALKK